MFSICQFDPIIYLYRSLQYLLFKLYFKHTDSSHAPLYRFSAQKVSYAICFTGIYVLLKSSISLSSSSLVASSSPNVFLKDPL